MMKLGDLVHITWNDIYDDGAEWKDKKELRKHKPKEAYTVGWIAKENDDYITLVTNYSEDDSYSGGISIPKGCITKQKRLV